MAAPVRWLLMAPLLACLALASAIIERLNLESGGWALFLLLCTIPLALGSLHRASRREALATWGALAAMFTLFIAVDRNAAWSVTITIGRAGGPLTIGNGTVYAEPTTDPARIPFHGINDAWAILRADGAPCTARWSNGPDRMEVHAPLKDFFERRGLKGTAGQWGPPIVILLALSAMLVLTWTRLFIRSVPPWVQLVRSREGLALTFLTGLLAASIFSPPSTWLSNEFLSRPDDWLCYESGARSILRGNILLMPPPGGVEMWSLLYTPIVAVLHVLLGPASGPLYVVQFASYLLLVPLFLLLIAPGRPWSDAIAAFIVLLFVVVDIDLHYAWHFLSDVLPLLLLTTLFIAIERRKDARTIALLCGMLYLARLEFIGIGAIVFLFLLPDRWRTTRGRLLFIGVHLLCLLPYFLRWYLLHGDLRPFPIAMEGTGHVPLGMMLTPEHLMLKLRALLGDLAAINPGFRVRYHWLAIHGLFIGALVLARAKRLFERTPALALACLAYVFATRMLSPSVGIYGHRHSLALILLEMLFVVLVMDRMRRRSTFAKQPRDPVL